MGATSHYAVIPATDPALVDAWFRLGFGQQHVHAIREAAGPDEILQPPAGIVVRPAERRDIPILGRLELALPEHQTRSPVFSMFELPSLEEATNEWEEGFDDPTYATFVAEHDGLVVGSAIGCSIEVSSEHHGIVRPADAGHLGFAAVWRETNLLSSRTWPRLGFRPTFRRLHRAIA